MKTVQVVLRKSDKMYFIKVDGKTIDGPMSLHECTQEMRHYNNDPMYKILSPGFENTTPFQNGRVKAEQEICNKFPILNGYPIQFGGRVKQMLAEGKTIEQIAKELDVPEHTVRLAAK